MSLIQRFALYAAAFEKTVETNDTSHIEPFFTEDAVYEVTGGPPLGGIHRGREAVLAGLIGSLDAFDRQFATREPELLEEPEEREDGVWIRYAGRYTKPGLPDLVIEGEEVAQFEGDRIQRLIDTFSDEVGQRTRDYLAEHAEALAGG